MIGINSTDEERTRILEKRTLTVVPWDKEKEMKLLDPDISIRRAIVQHARSMDLMGACLKLEGMETMPVFSGKSLSESIHRTMQGRGNLQSLAKMLTVLEKVTENAVLIEVEEYRHAQRSTARRVGEMCQYVSAFYDEAMLYPVKITVEQRKMKDKAQIYMIVTVGSLGIEELIGKQKEALPTTRVTSNHTDVGESLPTGIASFTLSIAQLVKKLNKKEGILLKNFPDQMLTEQQMEIKRKVLEKDMRKEQGVVKPVVRGR